MRKPAKRLAGLTDPSSFAEPNRELDQAIEKSSESLQPGESHSARLDWRRTTRIIAFVGFAAIVFGADRRFPGATAGSLSLAERGAESADHVDAKLIVNESTPRLVDQPVPIGVSVDHANDLSFLKVSGLPKGTTLSAGTPVGDDEWLLYATDGKDAAIRPPSHFVGVMQLTVSLIIGTGIDAVESRPLRFEWTTAKVAEVKPPEVAPAVAKVQDAAPPAVKVKASTPPPAKIHVATPSAAIVQAKTSPAAKAPDQTPPVVPPLAAPLAKIQDEAPPAAKVEVKTPPITARVQVETAPAAMVQDPAPPAAKSGSQKIGQLSPEETAALLKRGNELISSGDLAAARLVLRRAAEAGNARAAFALAGTYNPIVLEEHQVHGLSPDLAMARHWYEKARELGSQEASRELQKLSIRGN